MKFSLQIRQLLWGVTGYLLGNYWVITRKLLGNYQGITGELLVNYWIIKIICQSGIERIVFGLTSPSFLNLYVVAYF